MKYILLFLILLTLSCKDQKTDTEEPIIEDVIEEKDAVEVDEEASKDFREFKVLDSKNIRNNDLWQPLLSDMTDFGQSNHDQLKPLIFDQDIPTIQDHVKSGRLTYEQLTKFYLFRIKKYDREYPISLNSVIALNPDIIKQAKEMDRLPKDSIIPYSVYGMPILLKDNINTSGMATTAGAVALKDNYANDAFITQRLKEKGALILGKTNLSEWAYFFCGDCPSGYSAIGGQTLNAYGRRTMDTGGSSSGSGVAMAVNFAVAAIGSETSGSILSPSSQNSIVGLKPTIGLVSRSGIVPISSTLDTAGPMTRNVTDNAILLSAMYGEDKSDSKSIWSIWEGDIYFKDLARTALQGKRFGAIKSLMKDTLYINALATLKQQGAEIIEIEPEQKERKDFIRLLNLDMRKDLPKYFENYADTTIKLTSVSDVITFNDLDSINTAPYGQRLFKSIVADSGTIQTLDSIKQNLYTIGKEYFDGPIKKYNLNGILSINNYHAGYAAVAEYPAITVPMGYTEDGKPKGLTFITVRLREKQLLEWAYAYEQASKMRKSPKKYQ